MKRTFLALLASGLLSLSGRAAEIVVDDSYSPGERFARNHKKHPEIRWPALSFEAGQQIAFERPYKQVAGGRDLHLDIFHATQAHKNNQAIVLVHGGGWRSGNKSHFYPLANLLAQRGYTVVAVEYRLSTQAPYPAGLIDINDAISWLKANSERLQIDPDRIAIGGGSSGGHMAALAGFAGDFAGYHSSQAPHSGVNAIIDLDGVLDFTTPLALKFENKKQAKSAAALWLGGTYEQIPAIWREASPASYVGEHSPPTLIISSGQLRFTAGRQAVQATLDQHNIPHQYIELDETLHTFWLFEPYLSQTAQWIDTFLQRVRKQGDMQ
ncbi:alpha/beta hydrolase [Alteromonas gilva]|uniref:Alpha/beta hydrolase n=1 Tax=Alteromonas gilva TaxID=2987522 RepID=A0ABT5KXE5_9ALTE|nr:alpha/beta hydrolase [Alteromonas gilva]MDC8829444.1 alpha/beta hydrolase [Alteromonas gilva]